MANRLIYDPNKIDHKTKKSGVAFHVARNKELKKHCRFSHKQGDLVEWIGKDKRNRGMGIVLAECNVNGFQNGDDSPWSIDSEPMVVEDEDYTHLKVFWQVLMKEEIINKSLVRKVPDREIGKVIIKKKENTNI